METVTLAEARELPEGSKMAPRMSPAVLVAWEKRLLVSTKRKARGRKMHMEKLLYDEKLIEPQQSGNDAQANRMRREAKDSLVKTHAHINN